MCLFFCVKREGMLEVLLLELSSDESSEELLSSSFLCFFWNFLGRMFNFLMELL